MGFRKHNDGIGRFLSIDPLWETQPGHTPYHYPANNPINDKDPSGLITASTALPDLPGNSTEIEDDGDLNDPLNGQCGQKRSGPLSGPLNPLPLEPKPKDTGPVWSPQFIGILLSAKSGEGQ